MFSAGRKTMKACRRHKKNRGSCWTFFAPDPRTVTVLSIKQKHRTSIFFCINARQRAPPQMCVAGNHAARGSCGLFPRSASRLQHAIAEDSQICKVHGLSPTSRVIQVTSSGNSLRIPLGGDGKSDFAHNNLRSGKTPRPVSPLYTMRRVSRR